VSLLTVATDGGKTSSNVWSVLSPADAVIDSRKQKFRRQKRQPKVIQWAMNARQQNCFIRRREEDRGNAVLTAIEVGMSEDIYTHKMIARSQSCVCPINPHRPLHCDVKHYVFGRMPF
jgi:hypothetical protein